MTRLHLAVFCLVFCKGVTGSGEETTTLVGDSIVASSTRIAVETAASVDHSTLLELLNDDPATSVLSSGPAIHRGGSDCENQDIAKCVSLLEVLTNKDLGFAASLNEINVMCPVLLSGLQCIDSYTLRCLTPQHRRYFNKLYNGTIRVIKDLCNDKGKYQQEYIRHAPCMKKVNPKYNKCSEIYHKSTANLNHINEAVVTLTEQDKVNNVITLCCSFQEYLKCSERVVFEACGNETATFTKDFLNRMAGPIVQTRCMQYVPGSDKCMRKSGSGSLSSSLLLVVVSSLFYKLLLC